MKVPRTVVTVSEFAGQRVPEAGSDGAVDEEVDGAVEEEHEVVDGRHGVHPLGVVVVAVPVHALLRLLIH